MWNQLPEKYGKWNSVYRVFNRWSHSGLLTVILSVIAEDDGDQSDEIRALDTSHNKAHQDACRTSLRPEIEGLGKTKGGRNTKISAVTNSKGKATRLEIVPGNEHDNQSAIKTLGSDLEDLIVLADKGYDDQKIRRHVEKNGGRANIPPRSNNKQNIEYDKIIGKKRHVVENFFCRIKKYRRVATRYDRLKKTYLAFVTLSAIADWVLN